MTIQNYLIIEQNVVANICLWDGDNSKWTPPQSSIALVEATTPCMLWQWDSEQTKFILVEQIGGGQIGFTWDGTVLTTNQPKPAIPNPPINNTFFIFQIFL